MARNTSMELNRLWDPAWNVVICQTVNEFFDIVLYAYAFREHWGWFNRIGGSVYSIVVWKDYKCDIWVNFDKDDTQQHSSSDYRNLFTSATIRSNLAAIPRENGSPNIWLSGKAIVEGGEDGLSVGQQVSGVFFVGIPTIFAAYFCAFEVVPSSGLTSWAYDSNPVLFVDGNISITYEIRFLVFMTRRGNYRSPEQPHDEPP